MPSEDKIKYKRYAFISYSHKDVKEAKWLHKHLEYYKLPSDIFNEYDENNRYLRPVFRDKEDIGTGVLKSVLRKELEVSEYLIIICSPNSAQSTYVSQEAQVFIDQGRIDHIIPYIIDGVPKSGGEKECFPESLINHVDQFPDDELLGVNINEVGRPKAFIRVVSSLLNVEFDTLWKRHKREHKKRLFVLSFLFFSFLIFTYLFAVPLNLSVNLHDEHHHLPQPKDAEIIVNESHYPLKSINSTINVKLDGYMKFKTINIGFHATYYKPIKLSLSKNFLPNQVININAKRDDTYAVFSGQIFDINKMPINDAVIRIDQFKAKTDSNGTFNIRIPIKEQTKEKIINITKDGYQSISCKEIPYNKLKYILFPCR